MTNVNAPPPETLPSSRQLLRSTVIAVAVAAVLLVAIVLPAEYGVDPTGIGRALGLKQMGEIKVALAREAAADTSVAGAAAPPPSTSPTADTTAATRQAASAPLATSDSTTNPRVTEIALNPGQGREIKLTMKKGARVNYRWSTDRGVVNYDTHGDPIPMPRGFYHGYGKGQGKASDTGVLVAAFDGIHGWFWRNRGSEPLTVTLRVNGDYQELKEIK